MTDKIGAIINVGDTVIYARSQGDNLHFGTVSKINGDRATIRNKETGRDSVNTRGGYELLNVELIKKAYPEYFI